MPAPQAHSIIDLVPGGAGVLLRVNGREFYVTGTMFTGSESGGSYPAITIGAGEDVAFWQLSQSACRMCVCAMPIVMPMNQPQVKPVVGPASDALLTRQEVFDLLLAAGLDLTKRKNRFAVRGKIYETSYRTGLYVVTGARARRMMDLDGLKEFLKLTTKEDIVQLALPA